MMKLVVSLLLFGAALALPGRKSEVENTIDVYVVKSQGVHPVIGLPNPEPLKPLEEEIKVVPMTSDMDVFLDPSPLSIKVPQMVSSPNFEELRRSPVMIVMELTSDDDKKGSQNDYAFYYCPTGLTCLEKSDNFQNIKEALMNGNYNKALYFYPNKDIVNSLFTGNEDVQRFVVPEYLTTQGVINLSDYKIPFFLVRTPTQFNEAENELPLQKVGQVIVSEESVEIQPSGHGQVPILAPI